ncbi:MAG: AarF/ABC1/UbiB kinase family protein [Proteobacteria bacterium]|nr:AarF/ABC1/UbiB kinase family protein [Pseudomonadota bacterium]
MAQEQQTPTPPISNRWRFLIAYITTFSVIWSYIWLRYKGKLFGTAYRDERIISLHQKNAERIEESILQLQGLFIKVGQAFSIMTNFLPEEFRSGLQKLQDAVPPRPYSQIEARIIEELGKKPPEVFVTFEKEPIASASLGQVHAATTTEGRKVAVKVQHMGVEEMCREDLKTIQRILYIVKWFVKVRGLDNFYREIRSMINDELNFDSEAKYIEEIAAHFTDSDKVIIPHVIPEYSTSRVITMEYVDGIKITERDHLIEMGLDPTELAQTLVGTYCQMIFKDGVYHADPHPGNILVNPEGKLVFLDFGAVGYLSPTMRRGISSFLEAIIKGDEDQLLEAFRTMGFLRTGTNQSEAAADIIEHFHRKFQDEIRIENFSLSSVKIDSRKGLDALAEVWRMDIGIKELSKAFYMPKEWVLLERTGLLLAGICTHLDPEMKPTETIRPYLQEFVLGKDQDWSEVLFDLSREKLLAFLSLPAQIDKAITRSLAGKVTFRVAGIKTGSELLYAAGQQLMFTLLAIASGGLGIYFLEKGEHDLARHSAYVTGGFLIAIILSMIRARRSRRRK